MVALLAAGTAAQAREIEPVDALRSVPVLGASSRIERTAGMQVDPRFDVPTFLWGNDTTAGTKQRESVAVPTVAFDAENVARQALRERAALYRITTPEIDDLEMHNLQRLPEGGALVRFRNRIGGVEVFREQVNVLLDRGGALVSIGGFAMGAPGGRVERAPAFSTTQADAVASVLSDWKFSPAVASRLSSAGERDGYAYHALPAETVGADGAVMAEAARVKPVWFRRGAALLPAYYVEVQMRDGADARETDHYAYVVSADDGSVLFRRNQTSHAAFSYRVFAEDAPSYLPLPNPSGRNGFPHPTGVPDGYKGAFVVPNLVTLQNAPFSRNDPWLLPGATKTIGNNVEAFANVASPDGFGPSGANECNLAVPVADDLHACTSSPGSFDYIYDLAQPAAPARAQAMAGITNLFYMNNFLHDWFYDAGFDENAGNAQLSNYGRGGAEGDSIFAEAQDFTGANNANMTTPSDGQRPRMRMFLWNSGIALAKVSAPAAVAGVKTAGTAAFGPVGFDLTRDLVIATDEANPTGPTTTDGCTPISNAAAIAGKIALIDRGVCTFVVKVKNAQAAGAAGVLIVNNIAPGVINMAGDDASILIPAVSIPLADGNAIKAQLAQSVAVSLRIARASGVQRDGALDNSLIAHEWGHYISNRLIGNANGLNIGQGNGMGEGWADFHALLLLVKEQDRQLPGNASFDAVYPVTVYPTSGPDLAPDAVDNAFYYGIRRYPYSRDMSKNPLTFRHITDGVALPATPAPSPTGSSSSNAEVHNTGEVWASMLWECYSNLLNDTARLTFAEAQNRMKRYLVAGYKMTPTDPTFVNARDALLSAMMASDPQDHALCLAGFAKRGLGAGAVAPDNLSETNVGAIESFKIVATPGTKSAVVEYFHAAFGHYFITNIADEITKLDNGTFVGWARTGQTFNVYSDMPAGSSEVCRFFSTAFTPKSSHFYTPSAPECATVKQNPDWQFEAAVFAVPTPTVTGTCPASTLPVYRLYNNGQSGAPNHRYTTSLAIRTAMLAQGWIPEGYGDLGVIMCSPQ